MKAKHPVLSWRPNSKTRLYLERLGFLDGRTGTKRDKAQNLNKFLNVCVQMVAESQANPYAGVAGPDELRAAWIRFECAANNQAIERLQRANHELAALKVREVAP